MKLFICILATILAVQAFTEEQQKRLEKISRECVKVSNIDLKLLEKAEQGGELVPDPKLQIHGFCFSKKANLQNEKGEFNTDFVRDKLNSQMKDKAEVEKVLKLCLVKQKTPEATALTALACFRANLPKDVAIF